jgi:hypothetical protein
MINQLISSFNAGELSPYLESRTNLEKYRNGCRILENFLLTPYGPANRRAGLEYRGAAKLPSKRCRILGFNFTNLDRIVVELGEGYMRFWKEGDLIKVDGVPVEATAVDWQGNVISPAPAAQHPYTESQLREVRFVQVNNVVFFAHPDHPPYRLSRFSDTNWQMGEVPWAWSPTLDQNVTTTTITPSATSGNITLTASVPLFKPTHVGSFWQLDHATDKGILNVSIDGNKTSASFSVLGKWQIQTFGRWTADIQLQSSSDSGATWETRRTYVSRADYNVVSTGEESQETLLRFVITGWATTSSDTTPRIQLSAIEPVLKGIVRITELTGAETGGKYLTATATVLKNLGSTTATSMWYEGAFSNEQGYPNAVGLHESRLIFGGTDKAPNTIWGSVSSDFQNFRKGAFDSDSYSFTLASTTGGRINWLVSKSALLIGTSLDEWSLSASDPSRPLTATNVRAQNQSSYGSTSLPALVVNDTILYIQRMARKIRELIYTWSSESWISNDITALAEHTTRTRIQEVAYQRVPDAVYWFVTGDGQLVSMTYEREQQVVGFARHNTDGVFESVATINGVDSDDEVWSVVRRTINSQVVRYIERFKTGQRTALDTADKPAWFYLDAAVQKFPVTSGGITIQSNDGQTITTSVPPVSTTEITGLDHLEGKEVSIWAGVYNEDDQEITFGIVVPELDPVTNKPMAVTGGKITTQTEVCAWVVGLPYTSLLCPQRVDQQLADGTSQGRRMRIPRLNVKLYQSFGGEYSSDQQTWFPMVARKVQDFMDDSPPVLNEWTRLYLSSNWADGVDIYIRQTLPVPLTIAAMVPVWEASEGQN